jgi:hypothetical protein
MHQSTAFFARARGNFRTLLSANIRFTVAAASTMSLEKLKNIKSTLIFAVNSVKCSQ